MSCNRVNIAAEKGGESCWVTLRGDPVGGVLIVCRRRLGALGSLVLDGINSEIQPRTAFFTGVARVCWLPFLLFLLFSFLIEA